ncbi:MAG: hypothetical protein ACO1RX_08390 [Candidatus Sericytochromatia bacterium]
MKTHHQDPLTLQSRIEVTALHVPEELDNLQTLIRQLRHEQVRYRDAPLSEVMAGLRHGEVRHTRVLQQQGGSNLLLRGFYTDFFARLRGAQNAPSTNQSLYIEYFAIGTGHKDNLFSDTQLQNEIFRAVPDEFYDDGISTFYATTYLKKDEGNPPNNITVSSSTPTVVTVTDASSFVVNGRIQIETAINTYNCTVNHIAGNALTVGNITGGPLSNASSFNGDDVPAVGNSVMALHSEAGCFLGGAASASPNTGTLMNRKRLEQLKTNGISLLYDYILACTSVE